MTDTDSRTARPSTAPDIKGRLDDADSIIDALPWKLGDTEAQRKAARGRVSALAHQVAGLLAGGGWTADEIRIVLASTTDAADAPDATAQEARWRSAIKRAKKRRENGRGLVDDLVAENGPPSPQDYAWADAALSTETGKTPAASAPPATASAATAPKPRTAPSKAPAVAKKKRPPSRTPGRVPFTTQLPQPLLDDLQAFSADNGADVNSVVEMALREFMSTRGWRSTDDPRQRPPLIFVR